MEPDQGGDHNSREDDDTAMRGGGPPAHTSGAASSSSTNSGAPKFTYNLLHYPCYPSYEVLLEKRFKTLPLPTNEEAETTISEATSVSTALPLLLPAGHQSNEEEEDGGVDGRIREESTATSRPLNHKKRVHSTEEASREMKSESTIEKDAPRVEDAGDRPTKKMRRTPSRRSKEGKEVEVEEDKDEGSGVLPMMVEGGSSPLLTTTTSSASLLDLEVSGGGHLALLGANGLEPEDRPAEDDCEAEPTQSVEDEHCGSAMSLERGSVDSTTTSGSTSSSSSSSAPSASSPSATASPVGLTATATSASAGVRREGMTRDEMKASAVSLHNLIEPLADLQRYSFSSELG